MTVNKLTRSLILTGLFQFHVPISMVEELLPGSVAVVGQLHVEYRRSTWLNGLGDEFHIRLSGGSAAFLDVALLAAADEVFPRGSAVLASRHDMVEAQIAGGEFLATVLALPAVPGEYVSPIQSHRFGR